MRVSTFPQSPGFLHRRRMDCTDNGGSLSPPFLRQF